MCVQRMPRAKVPNESIALVITVLGVCLNFFPSMEDLDQVATLESISNPLFIDLMSKRTLAAIRLSFAGILFYSTIHRYLTKGKVLRTKYLKGSKIKTIPIHLDGIKSQVMFTSWCCNLLTLSFALNGIIAAVSSSNSNETYFNSIFCNKWMLRFALMIYDIAAPCSMLVSVVTKYVLWPQAMKGAGTAALRKPYTLIQHNFNIIASLVEVGVLGNIPVRINEITLAPLWGLMYIFFTWFITHRLVESGEPQFVYFFFDTSLGARRYCFVLSSLLVVQAIFYLFFSIIDDVLLHFHQGCLFNIGIVAIISSLCCRFRDY